MHARGLNLVSVRVSCCSLRGRERALGGALASLCVMVGLFAVAVAPASAVLPSEFGSRGSGAGQLEEPSAVAADNDPSSLSFGDVYVLDRANNRVDEFSSGGEFVRAWGWGVIPEEGKPAKEELQQCTSATGCQAGLPGSGDGQFEGPTSLGGIAVDNCTNSLKKEPCSEPEDPSVGDVYVLDQRNGRVEKFTAEGHFLLKFVTGGQSVAVGPTGTVYVGESGAVQEYTPEGVALGGPLKLEGAGAITGLAVNAESEIYVTEGEDGEGNSPPPMHPARHYGSAGEPLGAEPSGVFDAEVEGSARSLTLNTAGEVFVNHRLATGPAQVRGFSPTNAQIAAFATTTTQVRKGLAFDQQTGALYFVNAGEGVGVFVPPPPGPVVAGESADHLEPTAAVVHAVINPDAPPSCGETRYRVEYGLTTGYGKSAPLEEGALPPSFAEDPVEVPLQGLTTRTGYHYRFVASDECELEPVAHPGVETKFTTDGADATFTTQPPALIEAEFATDVRSTSATLHARINPLGSATSYHFVYGPSSACAGGECSVPVPDGQVGSGKTGVQVEQHLQGLTAGQGYHYRVVTTNTLGEERGEERSFTTQTGGEAGLPDGREWELVSPPDKHGAELFGADEHSFIQAAADGDGVVYLASAPTESQPQGNGEEMQVLAQRSSTAWSNRDLAVPHRFPIGVTAMEAYRAFSPELSVGVLQQQGSFEPALSKEATEHTPYLRDSATGAFTPLVTPADDTTNPFIPFGEETTEGQCRKVTCGPQFRGAAPDLTHIILAQGTSTHAAPLLQGTPANSLYEWAGGSSRS